MESWLQPLFDAEGMRAVDRWAIEEQGVPSLELMEAAGRRWPRRSPGLAPQGPVRVVCGKGNNGGDGLVAARRLRGDGLRGRGAAALARRSDASPADLDGLARRALGARSSTRSSAPASQGAPREPAAAAIEAINRCGAPVVACDIASGVDASSGEVEGAAVEADAHGQLPRRQARPADRARQVAHRRAAGGADRDPRRARPVEPAGGDDRPGGPRRWRRGAAPRSTKFSSGQVTIAGGSRGLTGAVRMSSLAAIRAGAGYATVAVPADLEAVFESGRAGGDVGRLSRAATAAWRRPRRRRCCAAFERAAAGVLGPGPRPRPRLGRAGARGASARSRRRW